jgi:hypothetical protein
MQHWYFPEDRGGEQNGLNDAGIEFFKSAGSLARETVQNSGDAHNGGAHPVTVRFHLRKVARAQLPGSAELKSVISNARDFSMSVCTTAEQKAANGEEFFKNALTLLDSDFIPVLQIADFNTTGLEGTEADQMKGWYRLVRKQGTTSMHGAGGGTFGIGQRAPFAYSQLRTVFYGTRTQDGVCKFIGKSILCSFRDTENNLRRAVGFWGTKKEQDYGVNPLSDLGKVASVFKREAPGTDLFIAGFQQGAEWLDDVLHSVIRNFFAALLHNKLVVDFEDDFTGRKVRLNSTELSKELLALRVRVDASERSAAEKRELISELDATTQYQKALAETHDGEPIRAQLPKLGEVALYVVLDDAAPSRVAYMRRPRILVFDRTQKAGLRGYAGVFICETETGNRLLAELEDPAHSKWDRQRRTHGASVLAELNGFVRDALKKIAGTQDNQAQDVPELGKFLPAESDEAAELTLGGTKVSHKQTPQETGHVAAKEIAKKTVTKLKRRPIVQASEEPGPSDGDEEGNTGGGGRTETDDAGGDLGGGGEPGTGVGESGGAATAPRSLKDTDIDFRSFTMPSGAVQFIVRSRKAGTADITIQGAGVSGSVPVSIESAEDERGVALAASDGTIRGLLFEKDTPRRLLVRLRQGGRMAVSMGVMNNG